MKFKWMFLFASCFTTVAAPPINYSHSGNTVEVELDAGLKDGECAWVGYTHEYEVFQFIGCITLAVLRDVSQVSKSQTIEADIGQCQTLCRSSEYFGLKLQGNGRTSCRCINVTDVSKALKSLATCSKIDDNNEFIIAKHPDVSVYKTVTRDVSKVLKEGVMLTTADYNCLKLLNPKSNTYQWGHCSVYIEVMCVSKKNATSVSLPDPVYHGSWKMAVERCLDENKFLIPYQKNIVSEKTAPFWTSNVRAFVVKEVTDDLDLHQTFRRYGYIKRIGADVYSLQFGQRDLSFKSLCKAQRSSGAPSPSTSHNMLISTAESNNGLYMGYTKDETGSNVAVFIALPLAAILLIAGIIGGVLLWRKRNAQTSSTDVKLSKPSYSSSGYDDIVDKDESTHEDYDIIKDDWVLEPTRNSANNHSYFVLEKTAVGKVEASRSNDYDYADEVEAKRFGSQNHSNSISAETLDLITTQSHKDKETGYDYAKIMSKDSGKVAKHRHQVNLQSCEVIEDTHYTHGKIQDGDNVDKKVTVNVTNDTYDHIKKDMQNTKDSQGVHDHGFNDIPITYDKLKDVAYDQDMKKHGSSYDREPYNVTNLAQVRQANTDNPYDHTS